MPEQLAETLNNRYNILAFTRFNDVIIKTEDFFMATTVTRRKRTGDKGSPSVVALAPQRPVAMAKRTKSPPRLASPQRAATGKRAAASSTQREHDIQSVSASTEPRASKQRSAAQVESTPLLQVIRDRSRSQSIKKSSATSRKPHVSAKLAASSTQLQATPRVKRSASTRVSGSEATAQSAARSKPGKSPRIQAPVKSARGSVVAAAAQTKTANRKSVAPKATTTAAQPKATSAGGRSASKNPTQKVKAADATQTVTKVRRARVPADFAAQYGETDRKKKRAPKETATARKARRNAEERERLRAIMTPDDNLLQRLARLGAIAPSADDGNGSNAHTPRRNGLQTMRRPRKWESRCGKCGVAGTFKAAAGVCGRCGAIAVRQ